MKKVKTLAKASVRFVNRVDRLTDLSEAELRSALGGQVQTKEATRYCVVINSETGGLEAHVAYPIGEALS